jgi:hypothetical protein
MTNEEYIELREIYAQFKYYYYQNLGAEMPNGPMTAFYRILLRHSRTENLEYPTGPPRARSVPTFNINSGTVFDFPPPKI